MARELKQQCEHYIALHIDECINGKNMADLPLALIQALLHVVIGKRKLTDKNAIAFFSPYMTELDLTRASNLSDPSLMLISSTCKSLKSINLTRTTFTEQGLCMFFAHHKNLKHLNLTNCYNVTNNVLDSLILARCNQITDEGIIPLLSRCPNLMELSLFACGKITEKTILEISNSCKNLRSLSLARVGVVTDASLTSIIQQCPNITDLNIARCRKLTCAAIKTITQLSQLRALDLTSVTQAKEASLVYLLQSCSSLHTLYLSDTENVTDAVILEVTKNRDLRRLYLSRQEKLTDKSLVTISNCPLLQVLNLSRCQLVTDVTMEAIAHSCHELDTVYLGLCTRLTPTALSLLFENCPKLETVELNSCTIDVATIASLCRTCFDLELLDLTNCNGVDSEIVEMIASHFPKLFHLGLAETNISDQDLLVLSNGLWKKSLDTLNVCGCRNVTGEILPALFARLSSLGRLYFSRCAVTSHNEQHLHFGNRNNIQGLDFLECVFFSGCQELRDNILISVLPMFKNLQTLVLAGCTMLTDESIQLIAHYCPDIQHLDLSDLVNITDDSIIALAGTKSLNSLTLAGCVQITDACITEVIERCQRLDTLILAGCPNISYLSLQHITKFAKSLKTLAVSNTRLTKDHIRQLRQLMPGVTIQMRHFGTSEQTAPVSNNNNNDIK